MPESFGPTPPCDGCGHYFFHSLDCPGRGSGVMEPKRFRATHRRSKTSPAGRHAQSFGIRVGYWPCLGGPFIALDFASHRFEVWYGHPSYLKPERTHA